MSNELDLNKVPSPDIFLTLSPEEQEMILELDSIKEFKKGHLLIEEGQYFKESYFVSKGVIRQFRNIDGEDKTSNFYLEDDAIHSITSASANKTSTFNLECLEDCKISVVSFEKEKEIYKRFPKFQEMCRLTTEKHLLEYSEQMALYMASTPEERYKNILENRSDLLDRVPQYHLASYLGIKPESLSRIRKRLAKEG